MDNNGNKDQYIGSGSSHPSSDYPIAQVYNEQVTPDSMKQSTANKSKHWHPRDA